MHAETREDSELDQARFCGESSASELPRRKYKRTSELQYNICSPLLFAVILRVEQLTRLENLQFTQSEKYIGRISREEPHRERDFSREGRDDTRGPGLSRPIERMIVFAVHQALSRI